MTFRTPNACLHGLIITSSIIGCSLTVPSQGDLFGPGGSAGTGGKASAATAGSSSATAGSSASGNGGGGSPSDEPEAGAAGDDGHVIPSAGTGGMPPVGEGGAGGEPPLQLPKAVLWLQYDFDDLSSLVAEDVSGNGRDGTLAGLSLPVGAVGHIDGALKLDGSQKQYVQLPNDILEEAEAIPISSWIKLNQALAWDRLFDFNSGESNWFFFSPTGWNNDTMTFGTRCATRTSAALAPEIMLQETVPIDQWHHIAVVFAKPFLRYYLDGQLKSELTTLKFASSALGKTNQNWIGRSVYPADPYLSGLVDDFRIYMGALTQAEVEELAAK